MTITLNNSPYMLNTIALLCVSLLDGMEQGLSEVLSHYQTSLGDFGNTCRQESDRLRRMQRRDYHRQRKMPAYVLSPVDAGLLLEGAERWLDRIRDEEEGIRLLLKSDNLTAVERHIISTVAEERRCMMEKLVYALQGAPMNGVCYLSPVDTDPWKNDEHYPLVFLWDESPTAPLIRWEDGVGPVPSDLFELDRLPNTIGHLVAIMMANDMSIFELELIFSRAGAAYGDDTGGSPAAWLAELAGLAQRFPDLGPSDSPLEDLSPRPAA